MPSPCLIAGPRQASSQSICPTGGTDSETTPAFHTRRISLKTKYDIFGTQQKRHITLGYINWQMTETSNGDVVMFIKGIYNQTATIDTKKAVHRDLKVNTFKDDGSLNAIRGIGSALMGSAIKLMLSAYPDLHSVRLHASNEPDSPCPFYHGRGFKFQDKQLETLAQAKKDMGRLQRYVYNDWIADINHKHMYLDREGIEAYAGQFEYQGGLLRKPGSRYPNLCKYKKHLMA